MFFLPYPMGVMAEQAVMTTRRFIGFAGGLLGATLLNCFQVIEDIVDRPDFHGLFFLLPGQGDAENAFDFTEQFNGIDTVKAVVVAEIIVQAWLLELKILNKDGQDFFLQCISGHGRSLW